MKYPMPEMGYYSYLFIYIQDHDDVIAIAENLTDYRKLLNNIYFQSNQSDSSDISGQLEIN